MSALQDPAHSGAYQVFKNVIREVSAGRHAVGVLHVYRDSISEQPRCAAHSGARQLRRDRRARGRSSRLCRGYRGLPLLVCDSCRARPCLSETSCPCDHPPLSGLWDGLGTSPGPGEAGGRLQTSSKPRSSSICFFYKKKYGVCTAVSWIFKVGSSRVAKTSCERYKLEYCNARLRCY